MFPERRERYLYDSLERLTSKTLHIRTGAVWNPAERELRFYDSLGRLATVREQMHESGDWRDRILYQYLYSGSGLLSRVMRYSITTTGQTPSTQSDYYYGAGRIVPDSIINQEYRNASWNF